MRFLALFVIAMIAQVGQCSAADSKSIDESQLEERDGLYYEYAAKTPYTGAVTVKFYDGKPRQEYHLKNGKKDGSAISWYANGRLRMQSSYKDGKRDGRWVKWDKNGQIQFQKVYKDGMRMN